VVPAVSEVVPLGPLQLVIWAAVLAAAVACMVVAVRNHAGKPDADGSDPMFWDLFGGAAVIVPALLIPAVSSPLAGLALAAVAAATGAAAYRGSPRVLDWYGSRRQRRLDIPRREAAVEIHNAVLSRWRRYELDPALAIGYPDMADVARPETSAFVKAMREAELLKASADPGYAPAVARLELALGRAETAAGVPGAGGSSSQEQPRGAEAAPQP
jgi:hypothetical protein